MRKSIQIVEKNYQKNQKRYRVDLASKYNDLALLYDELLEEHKLANNFFDKTAFLAKEVGTDIDLERDGLTLVRIYNNLALSYYLPKSKDCALEYLQKSIDITSVLEQFDINKYRPFLIDFYNNLAEAYDKISKYKVIPCYLKALELVQGLKEVGDELYNVKLAETYYGLIQFCISNDECDGGSILNYLEQYMQVLQKLESLNLDKHKEYLIRGYYTIGQVYEKQTNNSLMEEYYDKCWVLLKDVDVLVTPEIDYTDIYNDLSLYYQNMEKIEEVNGELTGKIQKRNFFKKFKNYIKK
jgi:hypothetical protein